MVPESSATNSSVATAPFAFPDDTSSGEITAQFANVVAVVFLMWFLSETVRQRRAQASELAAKNLELEQARDEGVQLRPNTACTAILASGGHVTGAVLSQARLATDEDGTVRPEIVLEVAFNHLQRSTRHSSGYALRFPRIVRVRPDRTPQNASTLADVARLAAKSPARKLVSSLVEPC